MKNLILLIVFFSLSTLIYSQDFEKITNDFKNCKNDSLFILENGINKFEIQTLKKQDLCASEKNHTDSLIFYGNLKSVIGPVENDGIYTWYKIVGFDYSFKIRAGNIWLNPNKRSTQEINTIANEVLENADKKSPFDYYCQKYADDHNKKADCDLGWFEPGMMVKEFETAVLKHKKGDIFRVETEYGTHLVKVIDDPKQVKEQVKYVELRMKK